jgi:hypothetical protein
MARWSRIFFEAGEHMGKSFRIPERSKEYITAAGFVDVTEKKYKLPIGDWSSDPKMKTLGQWNLLYCTQGLEGFALFLLSKVMKVSERPISSIRKGKGKHELTCGQWEYTEIQALLGQMRSALLRRQNHAYYEV